MNGCPKGGESSLRTVVKTWQWQVGLLGCSWEFYMESRWGRTGEGLECRLTKHKVHVLSTADALQGMQ